MSRDVSMLSDGHYKDGKRRRRVEDANSMDYADIWNRAAPCNTNCIETGKQAGSRGSHVGLPDWCYLLIALYMHCLENGSALKRGD